MEIINILNTIKSSTPVLSLHRGIGYCAYGSVLLHRELIRKKYKATLIKVSDVRHDTKESVSLKTGLVTTVLALPDEGIYGDIKSRFIKRGKVMTREQGHAVVMVDNTIYDITSDQFYLPSTYSLTYLTQCWSKIIEVKIELNDNADDFYVGDIKKIRDVVIDKQYSEGIESTFTHNGKQYQLDTIFKLVHGGPVVNVDINKLKWVLKYTDIDKHRLELADITVPVLVYNDPKYHETVVDGAHRLAKAVKDGVRFLPVIFLTKKDMDLAEIKSKPLKHALAIENISSKHSSILLKW